MPQGTFVMTDSNSGITQEQGKLLGISVVPMPFYIDEKEYFEDVSITREEFFRAMESDAEIHTSQPSLYTLQQMWEEKLKDYDQIVFIPMSSGLSGTAMSAIGLAQSYGGRVQVVDNHRISCTQKQSVLEAIFLAKQGWSGTQIRELLERYGLDASIYIAVDTLKYLKKGGRVTPAGAAVASVLNIKPILQIQGEVLDAYAKVRGMKAAQEKMLQAVEYDITHRFAGQEVIIKGAHTCTPEEAEAWTQSIRQRFPKHTVSIDPLSLSVACHIGHGATAIVCMRKLEETPELVYEIG